MAAPKGNEFWKLADYSHRQPKSFESPEDLWERACKYFEWCDNNPLQEEKLFHYQGEIIRDSVSKLRAYTLRELCLFLGVETKYFNHFDLEKHKDYAHIIARIRDIIYTQKFTGAAADLLNPNIIARELGLSDKKDVNMKADILKYTEEERLARIKELTSGSK